MVVIKKIFANGVDEAEFSNRSNSAAEKLIKR